MLTPDGPEVVIRRALIDPAPWRVRDPTVTTLLKLVKALGVPVTELLG